MTGGARGWTWLALVVVLVLLALVAGRPPEEGLPLDPDGVGPQGARALRQTLEELGAEVSVTDAVDGGADVVLVLQDDLTEEQRQSLVEWVDDGGRLVIADPLSPLTPVFVEDLGGLVDDGPRGPGRCTVAVLDDVGPIEPGPTPTYVPDGTGDQCFGGFVVEADRGRGRQRSVGSAGVFTNERLGDADNAVLAARLLEIEPGSRVTWLVRDRSVAGEQGSLRSLVSPGARAALLQVVVAAAVYVVVRGRRLGPPVQEPQPVRLAGSELVAAVGNLMQQRRDPQLAATLLRADLRSELAARLGLPADAPADLVAGIVADRFPIDDTRVRRTLLDHPVEGDDALVALARDIESIRQEVLHGPVPVR